MVAIQTSSVVALTPIDLGDLPESERELVLQSLLSEEAEGPFELSCGPLLRVTLLRLAPQEHVLLLNMHHIVSDGWSFGVLLRELSVIYQAYASEKKAFGGFDCTQTGVCSRQPKGQTVNSGQRRRKQCLAMGVGF